MRRWAGTGLAVGLLVALPGVASAANRVVWAGGQTSFQKHLGKRYKYGEVLAFFPSNVTIHVGDAVVWKGMSINFHTTDLPGTAGSALPLITPTTTPPTMVTGVNDFAGNPFWFNGHVPQLGFNPALARPSGGHKYGGTGRVDSGLPFQPGSFKVKFTKAGKYAYFCDVHPGMKGTITVVAKGRKIPTAAQEVAAIKKQQKSDTAEAKTLAATKISGNIVSLGLKGNGDVEILRMFQGVTSVPVGTTVKFEMAPGSFETHTATFGPAAYLGPLGDSFVAPVPDPRALFPSSPPPSPIPLDGTSHGNGFANTGTVADHAGSTLPAFGEVTFNQAGTYHFECLIHEFMKGVIKVT
jgi:plastocyanin